MKKLIVTAVVLLLVLTGISGGALTENAYIAEEGADVQLSVQLTAPAMAGMQACIRWDPICLWLDDTELEYAQEFRDGSMVALINPDSETGMLNLVCMRQQNIAAENLEVIRLTFRVRPDAPAGETTVWIDGLRIADESASAIDAEGGLFTIAVPPLEPTEEPTAAPEATATAVPQLQMAKLELMLALPEETLAPEATAEPEAELPAETNAPGATANPTRTPVPTNARPAGSAGSSAGSGTTATAQPTEGPTPTVPTIVIGGGTQAPVPSPKPQLKLKAGAAEGGFVVELIAEDTEIGGLQATILYDSKSARLITAAMSESFASGAMIAMINDETPGRITLVYSNVNGYEASGEAIFAARFAAEAEGEVALSLIDAKFTGTDANLSIQSVPSQNLVYEIGPVGDPDVVEAGELPLLIVYPGMPASITLDPGDGALLRLNGRDEEDIDWRSDNVAVAEVTPDGTICAGQSGLALLHAVDAESGESLAECRVCVRNVEFGLPLELLAIGIGDETGDCFSLAVTDELAAAYSLRGIRLCFEPAVGLKVVVTGLIPEEMTEIPAHLFDHCGNLTGIDIAGTQIEEIAPEAFIDCGALTSLLLTDGVCMIGENAMPLKDGFVIIAPSDSAAEVYAQARGIEFIAAEPIG